MLYSKICSITHKTLKPMNLILSQTKTYNYLIILKPFLFQQPMKIWISLKNDSKHNLSQSFLTVTGNFLLYLVPQHTPTSMKVQPTRQNITLFQNHAISRWKYNRLFGTMSKEASLSLYLLVPLLISVALWRISVTYDLLHGVGLFHVLRMPLGYLASSDMHVSVQQIIRHSSQNEGCW